jgi:hypothetical protein
MKPRKFSWRVSILSPMHFLSTDLTIIIQAVVFFRSSLSVISAWALVLLLCARGKAPDYCTAEVINIAPGFRVKVNYIDSLYCSL